MNPQVQQLKDRLTQIGAQYKSPLQAAFDYGTGAAIGASGQQLMNWITPGADPNPLLSGALYAPAYRAGRQVGRLSAMNTVKGAMFEGLDPTDYEAMANSGINTLKQYQANAPIEAALGLASQVASIGGSGASLYNTVAGGADIDNNIPSAVLGGLALAALAPLTYQAMKARGFNKARTQPVGTFNTVEI